MSEVTGTPEHGDTDRQLGRRAAMKAALGGAAAAAVMTAPRIGNFTVVPPYAAAASGTAVAGLQKDPDGTPGTRCLVGCNTGQCSNAARGSVTFARSGGGTPTISVTITISSGPSIVGRSIIILQNNGTTCLSQVAAGTWAASPAGGPQTFSIAVAAGATKFSVHIPESGGGGTDIYTSYMVTLP